MSTTLPALDSFTDPAAATTEELGIRVNALIEHSQAQDERLKQVEASPSPLGRYRFLIAIAAGIGFWLIDRVIRFEGLPWNASTFFFGFMFALWIEQIIRTRRFP